MISVSICRKVQSVCLLGNGRPLQQVKCFRVRSKRLAIGLRAILAIFAVTLFLTGTSPGQEIILHNFSANGTDGYNPYAGLIFDAAGNLYGTTKNGGDYGMGTVFELTPSGGGSWSEKILYSFNDNGSDGFDPYAGLIFDKAGNLYGTTYLGGAYGNGTVFELTPTGGGNWTEKVLHNFSANGTDGYYPYAGLIFGADGGLYGTTTQGGATSVGTVFELTSTVGGDWTEKVLYNFSANGSDGFDPQAGLIFDSTGKLYGTTFQGGAYDDGIAFELTPSAGGTWTENVLHSFNDNGSDGFEPNGGLISDIKGNFYGTTTYGGPNNYGTVFKLTPMAGGGWSEKVLYSFPENPSDGSGPQAGLIFDAAGNLYGTTYYGGAQGKGTVFELTSTGGDNWSERVLHSFDDNGSDGFEPYSGLIFDAVGNLFGSTYEGGTGNYGAVFEIRKVRYAAVGEQVDYFGEGKADFTVWRPSNGTFYSIDGSGTSLTKPWGLSNDIPVIGDYDGDGKTDVTIYRPSNGAWYIIQSSNGKVVTKVWGVPGDVPVPGDYDSDGKTDTAIYRPSNMVWYIVQSSNGKVVTTQWGEPGDVPVPGDYDGDGKTDIAVYRPSNGAWYIIQSSNGEVVTKQWGEPDDVPVPADYDGDGKTDIAMYRPSNGYWFVIQSSTGKVVTQQWGGQPGDKPVPRDYDGDLKADFAIWRPSNGIWYVIQSSNNQHTVHQWGYPTDIPLNKPVGQ
jgi:uncharacterized repeat protein (TIGR03803 family)